MKRILATLSAVALSAVALVNFSGCTAAVADAMHLHPPKTDKYDVGKAGLEWRNGTFGNFTVTGALSPAHGITDTAASINATNTTVTASNGSLFYLVNMSGNHTLTLPDTSTVAGRTFRFVDLSNKIGGTGNWTINATAGNVNRVDAITVTNIAMPSPVPNTYGNVSVITATCDSSYGWAVGVVRR